MRTGGLQIRRPVGMGSILGLLVYIQLYAPIDARAIPTQGDYTLSGGLTGTLTSNGSSLTAWNITDPSGSTWCTGCQQDVTRNDSFQFQTLITGTSDFLVIAWTQGDPFLFQSGSGGLGRFTVTLTNTGQVPELQTGSLLALGLLGLLGYGWRQRRQAGLQIG